MKLILAILLTLSAQATTLSGTIKNPAGVGVNGTLRLNISSQGAVSSSGSCGGPWVVVPRVDVVITLSSGVVSGTVVGNDCILPENTYYNAVVRDSNGNQLLSVQWSITGSSVDVGTLQPLNQPSVQPVSLPQNQITYGNGFPGRIGFFSSATPPLINASNGACYWSTSLVGIVCTSSGVDVLIAANPVARKDLQLGTGSGACGSTPGYCEYTWTGVSVDTAQATVISGVPGAPYVTARPGFDCAGVPSVSKTCIITSDGTDWDFSLSLTGH